MVPMTDPLDDAQQPRCPECRTVLVDAGAGFACRSCGLVFLESMPSDWHSIGKPPN